MTMNDDEVKQALLDMLRNKQGLVPGYQVIHDAQQMRISPEQALDGIKTLRANKLVKVFGQDTDIQQFADATVKSR